MERTPLGVFRHVRADSMTSESIMTKRVDLDGISLTGVMLRRIVSELATPSSTSDLSELIATVTALSGNIASLQAGAVALSTQISNLSSQIGALSSQTTQLTTAVAAIVPDLEVIKDDLSALKAAVATLTTNVQTIDTVVDEHEALLSTTRPYLDALVDSAIISVDNQ